MAVVAPLLIVDDADLQTMTAATGDIPIVVDLDGTLVRTDLLMETATQFVCRHPWRAPQLLLWLLGGRAHLKARLARATTLDPATLPYNNGLLDWLSAEGGKGRRLVLATASHRHLAEPVSSHLGLFNEVLATEEGHNLKGAAKRDCLVERFGQKGFDYLGNAATDLPVWAVARQAYVVIDPSTSGAKAERLVERVRRFGNLAAVFGETRPSGQPSTDLALCPVRDDCPTSQGGANLPSQSRQANLWSRPLITALRPHQWLKNLLLLVPLFAAHRYTDPASVGHAILGSLAYCLVASSAYLCNDLADLAHDRAHPTKRYRPLAAGDLSLLHAWVLWPLLLVLAITLGALALPPLFPLSLVGYFALTLGYSLWLKRLVLIDVLTLAGLYALRIAAGAAAIAVPPSFWLVTFAMFLFLSLAFVKRYAELQAAGDQGQAGPLPGRGYWPGDLPLISQLGTGTGLVAVLVLALYIRDGHTAELYRQPQLIWLACPLLLFWISRLWLLAHRGRVQADPVLFALRDGTSWLVAGAFLLIFGLARVLP